MNNPRTAKATEASVKARRARKHARWIAELQEFGFSVTRPGA